MEKRPNLKMYDLSPIQNGDFPNSHASFLEANPFSKSHLKRQLLDAKTPPGMSYLRPQSATISDNMVKKEQRRTTIKISKKKPPA